MKSPLKKVIKRLVVLLLAVAVWTATRPVSGRMQAPEPSREGVEFFEKKIRPILTDNCLGCHSAKSKRPAGGLLLDSREGVLRGGASGQPAVIPGDPEKSLLLKAVRYTDAKLQMPPTGRLTDEQIRDLENWIRMGAPDPRLTVASAPAAPSYVYATA